MKAAARLLRDPERSAAENMARDEAMLSAKWAPTLRLYRWSSPSLSLGWFQDPANLPWQSILDRGGEIVRRPTGGKAILHEQEWTWSLCAPEQGMFGHGPGKAMKQLHEALATALTNLDLGAEIGLRKSQNWRSDRLESSWCFEDSSPLDLGMDGRKLLGSAARRKDGWILFHGSLILTPPLETPDIASLDVAATDPRPCQALIRGLEQATGFHFSPGSWQEEEILQLPALRQKYENPEFTWARSSFSPPTELQLPQGR